MTRTGSSAQGEKLFFVTEQRLRWRETKGSVAQEIVIKQTLIVELNVSSF
jgi:hypothetical protein